MTALFVYGTLRQGFPNEHILTAVGGEFEAGYLHGHLIEEGWGAAQGCPGLKLAAHGQRIDGQVFTSPSLDKHWQDLDDFEGEEYVRTETEIQLISGEKTKAFVYVLK
ncbi:gamma-glutamylcyclotransferase [Alteromonas sp. NFXS44]|uniref:gamma-glutamylcyclotransferase family protein n=1 Tax=Alteromonas sp. NFXS44 TaxID=2818435 RepID=UPI0032DEE077